MVNIRYITKFIKIFEIAFFVILIFNICPLNSSESKEYMRKTIAIDLDGILNNYTKFDENNIPPIKNGAKEFIESLSKDYELILFTSRSLKQATKWLIENKIDDYFSEVTNIKPHAIMYIDDRSIPFRGNYNKTLEDIENFKVYWK